MKAAIDQRFWDGAKIDGKTYRFNDSGYMITGWYGNDEYYSSDPDRYGQLVPGVKR